MHISDFSNVYCWQKVHISALVCPVYNKAFNRFRPDDPCSFSNDFRIFSPDSEEYWIKRVRYADYNLVCEIHSIPCFRVCFSVSFKETFLIYFAWSPIFFLPSVCQMLESAIHFFRIQHGPTGCKSTYKSSSIFETL